MTEEKRCSDKYKKYSPFHMISFGKMDIWELFCPDWRYFDKVEMTPKIFLQEICLWRNDVIKEGNGNFSFIYSRNKKNGWGKYHAQFFFELCSSCEDRSVITVGENRHWSLYAFFCLGFLPFWYAKCMKLGFGRRKALAITLALYNVKNDVHEMLKALKGTQVAVTYCDVFSADHYLFRKLNEKKIPTVTVQHGFYLKDDYNFLLSESKYFVANCKLSQQYAMECGRDLVYSPGLMASIKEKTRKKMIHNKKFLILVDGYDKWDEETINASVHMLELLEQLAAAYGYQYIVRYHPMNQGAILHDQKSKCFLRVSEADEDVMNVINEVEFAVVGRSTVWFQVVSLLCPVFRYTGFQNDYMEDIKYNSFGDYGELEKLYQGLEGENIDNLKKIKQEYLGMENTLEGYQHVWEDIGNRESVGK